MKSTLVMLISILFLCFGAHANELFEVKFVGWPTDIPEEMNFDKNPILQGLGINTDIREGTKSEQELTDQERSDLEAYRQYHQTLPRRLAR